MRTDTMICLDSSVWIDYFNGRITQQTDWLDAALGNKELIIGDLILTEVLQGFQNDENFRPGDKRCDDCNFLYPLRFVIAS